MSVKKTVSHSGCFLIWSNMRKKRHSTGCKALFIFDRSTFAKDTARSGVLYSPMKLLDKVLWTITDRTPLPRRAKMDR